MSVSNKKRFKKILIANRGEIACRIIDTANKLGVRTVAVYSDVDENAKHVSMADEAWCIGSAPATESYLLATKIIEVAVKSGAQAIHPGYGFLSENSNFAQLCADNNLIFIGPSVAAIEAMGSKSSAKSIMSEAGVPLVPGYHGRDQSVVNLLKQAHKIGFPVLLKATAGGGGKGMRIIESEQEFNSALEACKREALSSFSDDEVLIEKYLRNPRHIEVQIFADNHGNIVHLFDRDCSLQRRHQKVIEEAPAPGLSKETRNKMAAVAIVAAKTINYSGAGTIEFLYDTDGSFYFMEMNTRLQVEHPVTEMITGIDLVQWQLLVAANLPLPLSQDDITCSGHAFEARVYAEDCQHDFLPSTGKIVHLNAPKQSEHVRIDTGIRKDDQISIYYDPMIAKVIVWDHHRETALARLSNALTEYEIVGCITNLTFLRALSTHQKFIKNQVDTSFINVYLNDLLSAQNLSNAKLTRLQSIALATLYQLFDINEKSEAESANSDDHYSPWNQISSWSNNLTTALPFEYRVDGVNSTDKVLVKAQVTLQQDCLQTKQQATHSQKTLAFDLNYTVNESNSEPINTEQLLVAGQQIADQLIANIASEHLTARIVKVENTLHILTHGKQNTIEIQDSTNQEHQKQELSGNLTAPMPGTIIAVHTKVGQFVEVGQPLITLEAMKMEHTINANIRGKVSDLFFEVGALVEDGAELMTIEEGTN